MRARHRESSGATSPHGTDLKQRTCSTPYSPVLVVELTGEYSLSIAWGILELCDID